MQIVLLILMLFVVKAFLNNSDVDSFERWRQQSTTISGLMEFYQKQNTEYCLKNVCSTGVITAGESPTKPDTINNEWAYGTNFLSAYGTATSSASGPIQVVATVYYPPQYGAGGSADPKALFGWVGSNLRGDTTDSIFAGQWDAATQSINGGSSFSYNGTTNTLKIMVPQGFAGLTLQDKQPIIITQIQQTGP